MNRLTKALKETAKYWGFPIAVAFAMNFISQKEDKE